MKRVLFIVNHDIVIYNFRKELVQKLINNGHEVYIVTPMGDRIHLLEKMGAHILNVDVDRHGKNPFKDLKLIKIYKKIMKEISPDVVLTYTIKPNIYGGIAAKSLKIPYVANITGLGTAVEKKGLLQKITIFLYKYALKRVNTIFFQNQENMNFFRDNRIQIKKHKLLPGSGVNTKDFSLMQYPKDEVVKFIFIGRLMKEKGIDYYLKLASDIKLVYSNTEFHVCGFLEQDYKAIIEELQGKQIIIYHGLVMDMKTILKDMHCTIHPSYYPEGISNVLLESAAVGKPLITFDRSGLREVVDNNINGFIVELHNYNQLLEITKKFITLRYEEKKKLGLNGRKKVELEFDRDIVVQSYLTEINKI
jgi:galacturonosyltransferase